MALLLVPLVSLIAIWAFAAAITADGVFGLMNVKHVTDQIAYPVEDTVDALSAERRDALVYLADPHDTRSVAALRAAELKTDKAFAVIRANSADASTRADLDSASRTRLDGLLRHADALGALRDKVDGGTISSAAAIRAYDAQIDPYYGFFLGLDPVRSVSLDRQERVLVELARAREAVSREDALYSAAQVTGRMTRAEQRAFSDAVSQQRTVYSTYPPLLPAADAAAVADFWKHDPNALNLHRYEERALDASPQDAPGEVSAHAWNTSASAVLSHLTTLDRRLADHYMDRVQPYAVGVLAKAAVAGGFGLIAVLVSVAVSLRVGRGLVRDLSALRNEATESAGTRLPRVMRRLAAGEEIDVETEVPRLPHAEDEIGAVGKALHTLQRAAVEAAVRQADLRRGVSDVFVNLARRNQVLLHRQLTLLDAMERRTEAGDELADLFRLDHMTTRMRRHAEGLVILSGAAPSRQWRNPVPLVDVVRAAVAEVEDYERVEVRRMPRLAVTGSAVADLTHLMAELVENGTVFSPPHTTVQIHGERVANGYVLEIDDRGLGMDPDSLLDANLRLTETSEFELSDTDRLGLFVVSRLAHRSGVRVSLRSSPYGGITAVVLVPNTLLTEVDEEEVPTEERALPDPAARPAARVHREPGGTPPDTLVAPVDADEPEQTFHGWEITPTAHRPEDFVADARRQRAYPPRQPEPSEHGHASGRPDGQRAGGRPRSGLVDENAPLPRRRRATGAGGATGPGPASQSSGPVAPSRAPAPAAAPDAGPADVLPRRVRQASLAPQLREQEAPSWSRPADDDRDPDDVRRRMASLQRGWRRGRAAADESVDDLPTGRHRTIRITDQDADGVPGDATRTTSEGDGR